MCLAYFGRLTIKETNRIITLFANPCSLENTMPYKIQRRKTNSTFAIYLPASQGTEPAGERISGNIGENNKAYFFRKYPITTQS